MRLFCLRIAAVLFCGAPSFASEKPPAVPPELLEQAREAKEQFSRGNYLAAEKTYREMLRTAPNNVYLLSNLGVVLFRRNKLREAEDVLEQATVAAPGDSFSHCTLGTVYYTQGKYDEAIKALGAALAIDPKNHTAHNYLGITASQKGLPGKAVEELKEAVALDPNYTDAIFNLAVVLAMMNPPAKENARRYSERAIELGAKPDSALEKIIGWKADAKLRGIGDFLTPLEKERLQLLPAERK